MVKKLVECKSCGDQIPAEVAGKSEGYCVECYREIKFGEIPSLRPTAPATGPRGGGAGKEIEDVDGGGKPEDFEGIDDGGGSEDA